MSADDSELGGLNSSTSSVRPLKRSASEMTKVGSPAGSLQHPGHHPSPVADLGLGMPNRNASIDPPGQRSFTPTLPGTNVPIHLNSPFPTSAASSPGSSSFNDHQRSQAMLGLAGANGFNGLGGHNGSTLPPMTDEQMFFYNQHLAQQQANKGSPNLGQFGFQNGMFAGGNGLSHHGLVNHPSPLNHSFDSLSQHQQQQQQQQQQYPFQQNSQHHPLASLLAITTPQTASSPYSSFSSSFPSSFGGQHGGLHQQATGLRSHVSSPHSNQSSFGPTPPNARPSFNETDAMFRLRMCCKLDDRLVSNDPGCLAFCQSIVSSLGVTHADCLALPENEGSPSLVDSPGSNFDPTTPRSPNGGHKARSNRPRYTPILSVWAIVRPLFPLGPENSIREAMEAGTRAARFIVRSAQEEAKQYNPTTSSNGGLSQPTTTTAGKPWLCGEWIQCKSSNGVMVHSGFLGSLTERLTDQSARSAKASSLSTPQTEPSPASTQPSPSNGAVGNVPGQTGEDKVGNGAGGGEGSRPATGSTGGDPSYGGSTS